MELTRCFYVLPAYCPIGSANSATAKIQTQTCNNATYTQLVNKIGTIIILKYHYMLQTAIVHCCIKLQQTLKSNIQQT